MFLTILNYYDVFRKDLYPDMTMEDLKDYPADAQMQKTDTSVSEKNIRKDGIYF